MKTRQLGNSIRQIAGIAYGNEIPNMEPFKYNNGELVKVWRRINRGRWGMPRGNIVAGDIGLIVKRKSGMLEHIYEVLIQRTGKYEVIYESELNFKFTKKMRKDLAKSDDS